MFEQMLPVLIALLGMLCMTNASHAKEIQAKDAAGRDYWLYTPDTIDPDKTYTLVLGVHGYKGNGKGAGGYANWVHQHDVIVLGPTFDSDGYQYLYKQTDQQALDLIQGLHKQYKLNKKIFVAGFSGGAQFAHRFAMKYPDLVAGCAAHSGGTWATGDYEKTKPNPKARGVLFAISCGENDTDKSFNEAPMGRLEWAQKYAELLQQGGYTYDAKWWPDTGHRQGQGAQQMSEDCFIASTQLLPAYDAERDAIDKAMRAKGYAEAWSILKARLADKAKDDEGILGKVHHLYIDSLTDSIDRIDRMAEREVQKVIREHNDPQQCRAALEQLKTTYAGAPKTMQAIEKKLAALD